MQIIYDHQIFTSQNHGGPSRYFVELIKELIIIKNEPIIVSPLHNNINLEKISNKYKKEFQSKINKNYLTQLYNNLVSKYYFNKLDYDLYHLTYYNDCISTKKPKVITVYDLIHENYMDEFDLKYLPKKKILKEIDHFICISNNTKNDLIKYYNIDEKKISVTYLASFIKTTKNEETKFSKPFFLYVGSRKRYKNFRLLLQSYSHLKDIKKNFDIICFGGGSFLKEEIDYMDELSIDAKNVHQISGTDETLISLYRNSEALIYPSQYEGFGLPILEAMSCGCPVLSSNSSSLPEVYGDAALTFENNSVENLINCIKKIVSDKTYKNLLINKGYKRVKEFSWKKCAEETSNVYESLI